MTLTDERLREIEALWQQAGPRLYLALLNSIPDLIAALREAREKAEADEKVSRDFLAISDARAEKAEALLMNAVDAAAARWCGEKERETFQEDMEYFAHSWRHQPGLTQRVGREIVARAEKAEAEVKRLREGLKRIQQWCGSYPETVFTVPDLGKMREVLTNAGMPTALDAAHGTWARRLLTDIGGIAGNLLAEGEAQ